MTIWRAAERRALLVATALVSLVVASGALGVTLPSPKTLTGSIERGGRVTLRIHFKNGHHEHLRVYRWTLVNVPVRCGGHWRTDRLKVTGGETIWNRYADAGFGYATSELLPHGRRYVTAVQGRLLSTRRPFRLRRHSRGTVRVHGFLPLQGGGQANCESGRLRWTAATSAR